jgi:hypothetical protein
VVLVPPEGAERRTTPAARAAMTGRRGTALRTFRRAARDRPLRRGLFAVDLSVDGRPFGQVESAFVTVARRRRAASTPFSTRGSTLGRTPPRPAGDSVRRGEAAVR